MRDLAGWYKRWKRLKHWLFDMFRTSLAYHGKLFHFLYWLVILRKSFGLILIHLKLRFLVNNKILAGFISFSIWCVLHIYELLAVCQRILWHRRSWRKSSGNTTFLSFSARSKLLWQQMHLLCSISDSTGVDQSSSGHGSQRATSARKSWQTGATMVTERLWRRRCSLAGVVSGICSSWPSCQRWMFRWGLLSKHMSSNVPFHILYTHQII